MGDSSAMSVFPRTQVPLTVPGCVAWMDAADTSTITSSSGNVSSVRNKANIQIPFIQATGANQPNTDTRAINGKNVLDFNGTSDFLTASSLSSIFTGSDIPLTVFFVCECDNIASGTQNTMWSLSSSLNATPVMYHYYQTSNNAIFRRDDSSAFEARTAAAISGVNVNCIVFNGTTVFSYTNGTTLVSNGVMNVGALTLSQFAIGALSRTTTTLFFDGGVGELIVYNRALSDSDRILVQQYLGNKWGVAAP
jgi:hypothetical protein